VPCSTLLLLQLLPQTPRTAAAQHCCQPDAAAAANGLCWSQMVSWGLVCVVSDFATSPSFLLDAPHTSHLRATDLVAREQQFPFVGGADALHQPM
jgi:hypothetical protein